MIFPRRANLGLLTPYFTDTKNHHLLLRRWSTVGMYSCGPRTKCHDKEKPAAFFNVRPRQARIKIDRYWHGNFWSTLHFHAGWALGGNKCRTYTMYPVISRLLHSDYVAGMELRWRRITLCYFLRHRAKHKGLEFGSFIQKKKTIYGYVLRRC